MSVHVCMLGGQRLEISVRCSPQTLSTLIFKAGSFMEPRALQYAYMSWPASPGLLPFLPPQCWEYRHVPPPLAFM